MWRWIFAVLGGVVALRIAANLWVEVYQERPISTLLGTVLVVAVVFVLAVALLSEARGDEGVEVRRASEERGPRVAVGDSSETAEHHVHHVVQHVVHHHQVEHVHRYVGDAHPQQSGPVRALPPGPVVEGVVVRRAIGSGSA